MIWTFECVFEHDEGMEGWVLSTNSKSVNELIVIWREVFIVGFFFWEWRDSWSGWWKSQSPLQCSAPSQPATVNRFGLNFFEKHEIKQFHRLGVEFDTGDSAAGKLLCPGNRGPKCGWISSKASYITDPHVKQYALDLQSSENDIYDSCTDTALYLADCFSW